MNAYDISDYLEKLKVKARFHSFIQIVDSDSIKIEYCKRITAFDENYIRLELAKCFLEITGLNLTVSNYSKDGIYINGSIHSMKFEDT